MTRNKVGVFPFDCLNIEIQEKIASSLKKAGYGFKVFRPELPKGFDAKTILIYPQKNSNFQLLKQILLS